MEDKKAPYSVVALLVVSAALLLFCVLFLAVYHL